MMKTLPLPSIEVLNEWLHYNPDTGILTWKKSPGHNAKVGKEAGHLKKNGYRAVVIAGIQYKTHRVIWKMIYGNDPDEGMYIDHINRIKNDNRLCNLRVVTPSENRKNQKCQEGNISGIRYFTWSKKDRKWRVRVMRKSYGFYKTLDEAIEILQRYNDSVV